MYTPDQTKTHIEYSFIGERELDSQCVDMIRGKVHDKELLNALVKTLQAGGFKMQVSRNTSVQLIDDPLPTDEDDDLKKEE